MDNLSKKIGTREEVYKGIASRTAGGLTNTDIIEKTFNGKLIYISKKISEKMKAQMTALLSRSQNTQQNTQLNTNTNINSLTFQQLQDYNKNKKILKKNKKTLAAVNTNNSKLFNKHKSKTQKLSFQVNNNEVKNVYYPELKGLDLKELKAELLREEQEEDFPDLEEKDNDNDNDNDNINDNNNNRVKKPLEPFKIEELPDIDINCL
jgi:hypothetical protein